MSTATPIVRSDSEGERLWFAGGGVHTWKISAKESAGSFILFEMSLSRGKETPLHTHPNEDEMFYVLDGEILVHMAGVEYRLGPHGLAMAPRGVPHAFKVTSEVARVLCFETPCSAEAFYRGASDPASSENDMMRPPDFSRVVESGKRNGGIELLGPPPF